MFQVKICGITTPQDARRAAEAGADAVGLNFYPQSARYLDARTAAQVASALPRQVARVGVFVNESPEVMRRVQAALALDYLQLHGDEPVEWLEELGPLPVIRAFRCGEPGVEPVLEYLATCEARGVRPAAVLLDAYAPEAYGGTGRQLDWLAVKRIRPRLGPRKLILAGGLTAENVGRAIRSAEPDAVDTASGVESQPGRKDPGLMEAFVAGARRAFAELRAEID